MKGQGGFHCMEVRGLEGFATMGISLLGYMNMVKHGFLGMPLDNKECRRFDQVHVNRRF